METLETPLGCADDLVKRIESLIQLKSRVKKGEILAEESLIVSALRAYKTKRACYGDSLCESNRKELISLADSLASLVNDAVIGAEIDGRSIIADAALRYAGYRFGDYDAVFKLKRSVRRQKRKLEKLP